MTQMSSFSSSQSSQARRSPVSSKPTSLSALRSTMVPGLCSSSLTDGPELRPNILLQGSQVDEFIGSIRQKYKEDSASHKPPSLPELAQIVDQAVAKRFLPITSKIDLLNAKLEDLKSFSASPPVSPPSKADEQKPLSAGLPTAKLRLHNNEDVANVRHMSYDHFLSQTAAMGHPFDRIRGYKVEDIKNSGKNDEQDGVGLMFLYFDSEEAVADLHKEAHAAALPTMLNLHRKSALAHDKYWLRIFHDRGYIGPRPDFNEERLQAISSEIGVRVVQACYRNKMLMVAVGSVPDAVKACRRRFWFEGGIAFAKPSDIKRIPVFCRRCGRPGHMHKDRECPEKQDKPGTQRNEIFPCLTCNRLHKGDCKFYKDPSKHECRNCTREGLSNRNHKTEHHSCPCPEVKRYRTQLSQLTGIPPWFPKEELPAQPGPPLRSSGVNGDQKSSTSTRGRPRGSRPRTAKTAAVDKSVHSRQQAFLNPDDSVASQLQSETAETVGFSATSPIVVEDEAGPSNSQSSTSTVNSSQSDPAGSSQSTAPSSQGSQTRSAFDLLMAKPSKEPEPEKPKRGRPRKNSTSTVRNSSQGEKHATPKRKRVQGKAKKSRVSQVVIDDSDDYMGPERISDTDDSEPAARRLRVRVSSTRASIRSGKRSQDASEATPTPSRPSLAHTLSETATSSAPSTGRPVFVVQQRSRPSSSAPSDRSKGKQPGSATPARSVSPHTVERSRSPEELLRYSDHEEDLTDGSMEESSDEESEAEAEAEAKAHVEAESETEYEGADVLYELV